MASHRFQKNLRWIAALVIAGTPAVALADNELRSPDGRLVFQFSVEDGAPGYSLSLGDRTLLERSPLGLETTWADFTSGVSLASASEPTTVRVAYDMHAGKRASVDRTMREASYELETALGRRLEVVVRVGNDSVAFAYRFPKDAPALLEVVGEASGFALPEGATGFLHPMAEAKSGWSRTQPSYEEQYSIEMPVGEPSRLGHGWCLPALFKVGDAGWLLVSETGVDAGYCGVRLAHESPGGLYTIALPQPAEQVPSDPVHPSVAAGSQTPWRTIVAGSTLAPIVESTLATDLVEPIAGGPQLAPGCAAWSWLKLKDQATVPPVQREFIDMAAELDWEYVLIDCYWDRQIGRERAAELIEYADQKGVGVLLWYNSNGEWNDAPLTPRNRMHTREVRREEMQWLAQVGAKGVKVDFFGGDKQSVMQLYEAILRDAADFGLSVNFHGATLPRGWQRMYPAFATAEAVRGMEFCTFNQDDADAQPVHCTVLPFARNAVAPMDFTPVVVSRNLGPGRGGPRRRTRLSFELALPVVFFSPITHFGLTPDGLESLPNSAIEYLRAVPTVWDETRFVAGYPGKHAALARRNGSRWYFAAINAQDSPVTIPLPDDLPPADRWQGLVDAGVNAVTESEPLAGDSVTIPSKGGVVLWAETEAP